MLTGWKWRLMARLIQIFIYLSSGLPGGKCLRNVTIDVPVAVTTGQTVKMRCTFDLEGEALYTVKWYKGRQEFFRYVPKEMPHTSVFSNVALNVDINLSGANEVVLRNVQKEMAGKYRCEVSADAPSFHTSVVSAPMHVVYAPDGEPTVMLEKNQYAIGDTLRGNCTSPPTVPASNITWFVNGKQVNGTYVNKMNLSRAESASFNSTDQFPQLWVTKAGLQFEVSTFQLRQLKILCVADLFKVYTWKAETVLMEEKPRLASILYTGRESSGTSNRFPGSWILIAAGIFFHRYCYRCNYY